MRSITTWYRIEPRSDDAVPGPDRGLQARIFDPAWLLGRQWQLGELTGEDAASPAWVRVRAAASRLDQLEVGGTPIPIDSHRDLEPLVETEPTELADPWRGVGRLGSGRPALAGHTPHRRPRGACR